MARESFLPNAPEKPVRLYAVLGLCVLGICIAIIVTWSTGRRMTVHHARLVHTATEIKFQVSQAHIWLEEGLLGDPAVERDTFMTHLDQAESLAVAMLEGGMGAGEPLRPVQTAGLRREIRSLRGSLAQYRSQSLERWALREQGTAQVGSPRDQRLDSVYQEVVESNQAMI